MLGRHDGDTDIGIGAAGTQARGAVLRQSPLGDVEARDDLDTGDDGLRQHAGGRCDLPQQAVDPEAHGQPGLKGLDMDVAGAQLDGLFQEIVDRAHDRRAAGEIAQAFDIVLVRLPEAVDLGGVFRAVARKALIQHDGQIVECGNPDFDRGAENDLGRASCRKVGRVRHRKQDAAIGGLIGKYQGFAQKALREGRNQRRSLQHFLERHAR